MFTRRHASDDRQMTDRERALRVRRRWRSAVADDVRVDHGGLDAPASLTGALVAIAVMAIIASVLGAIFSGFALDVYHSGPNGNQTVFGAILGALVLLIAFFWGGWTAGRSARYGAAANGLMVVVWTVAIGALLVLVGHLSSSDQPLLDGQIPSWLNDFSFKGDALISGLAGLAIMVIGALFGAARGVGYHRRLDRELLAEPEDMVEATPEVPDAPASMEADSARASSPRAHRGHLRRVR
jgi:amino acid transporter